MDVSVAPGKYVVAVSGGVDSVVLLNTLSKLRGIEIVVAHYDHGIRPDSASDCIFVRKLARRYGFPFEFAVGNLGTEASEALARKKRYEFLESIREKYDAIAIMTAHHEDDVLETACINLMRGTGRKGLTSLQSGKTLRPLLGYKKGDILDYATKNGLEWREDSTNTDTRYLRNRIRKVLINANPDIKHKLAEIIQKARVSNREIDVQLQGVFNCGYDKEAGVFSQQFFISLPHNISCELLAYWLRSDGIQFDKKTIERLVVGLKTSSSAKLDVSSGRYFSVLNKQISLERT